MANPAINGVASRERGGRYTATNPVRESQRPSWLSLLRTDMRAEERSWRIDHDRRRRRSINFPCPQYYILPAILLQKEGASYKCRRVSWRIYFYGRQFALLGFTAASRQCRAHMAEKGPETIKRGIAAIASKFVLRRRYGESRQFRMDIKTQS